MRVSLAAVCMSEIGIPEAIVRCQRGRARCVRSGKCGWRAALGIFRAATDRNLGTLATFWWGGGQCGDETASLPSSSPSPSCPDVPRSRNESFHLVICNTTSFAFGQSAIYIRARLADLNWSQRLHSPAWRPPTHIAAPDRLPGPLLSPLLDQER
jgi:hypothetical protein